MPMRQLMSRLWKDDCGALLAVEWVFVATILVIGSITGLVAVRQAILEELEDFADAVMSLSTSWHFHDSDELDDEGGRHHRNHQHGRHGHDDGGDDFNRHIGSFHHEHED